MSYTQTPSANAFIARLVLMYENSTYLFPKTIGMDNTQQDLVSTVYSYKQPRPEDAVGADPSYIFTYVSDNAIVREEPAGRDDGSKKGGIKYTWEFYNVVISLKETFEASQTQTYDVIAAMKTTLAKNKYMNDLSGLNPMAINLTWIDLPFLLNTTNTEMVARNLVTRVQIYVSNR